MATLHTLKTKKARRELDEAIVENATDQWWDLNRSYIHEDYEALTKGAPADDLCYSLVILRGCLDGYDEEDWPGALARIDELLKEEEEQAKAI